MNHCPVAALWWRKSIPQAFETSRNLMPSASRGRERSARTASSERDLHGRESLPPRRIGYHLPHEPHRPPPPPGPAAERRRLARRSPGDAAEAPSRPLTLEAVKVEPASPRPDTLCHLTVTVKNAGAQAAASPRIRGEGQRPGAAGLQASGSTSPPSSRAPRARSTCSTSGAPRPAGRRPRTAGSTSRSPSPAPPGPGRRSATAPRSGRPPERSPGSPSPRASR